MKCPWPADGFKINKAEPAQISRISEGWQAICWTVFKGIIRLSRIYNLPPRLDVKGYLETNRLLIASESSSSDLFLEKLPLMRITGSQRTEESICQYRLNRGKGLSTVQFLVTWPNPSNQYKVSSADLSLFFSVITTLTVNLSRSHSQNVSMTTSRKTLKGRGHWYFAQHFPIEREAFRARFRFK